MSRFTDNWATSHRNWSAIFAAISLGALLLWALNLKQEQDARTFLHTDRVMATITDAQQIEREGSNRYGVYKEITYIVFLTLEDGTHLRYLLLQPAPKIGSKVPVLIDVYDDGKKDYHYNIIDWQLAQ